MLQIKRSTLPKRTHQPHDKLFKQLMGCREVACAFIRKMLPQSLVSCLSLESLKVISGEMVSPSGESMSVDYACRISMVGGKGEVILLIEHQSQPDKLMALRMQRYATELMYQHRHELGKGNRIPWVLPMVFYTGVQRYKFATSIKELVSNVDDDLLMQYQNSFLLKEISHEMPGKEANRDALELFFAAFKIAQRPSLEKILALLDNLDMLDDYTFSEGVCLIKQYVLREIEVKKGVKMLESIKLEREKRRKKAMPSLADLCVELGKKEGKKEGKRECVQQIVLNMIRDGLDPATVSGYAQISVREIRNIAECAGAIDA